MRIDLHTHSAVSDGTDTPAELVANAATAGLDVVALTDHDTTLGWPEADKVGQRLGIVVVPGAEISTVGPSGAALHLLGYFFEATDPALAAELDRIRDDRVPRLRRMTERLAANGSEVTWQDVLDQADAADSLGRPHLADALVARREAASREDAFNRLIGTRSPAYVAKHAPLAAEMIRLVRAAGGVTVIAHPWSRGRRRGLPPDAIATLAELGLTGLEVDHPDHDAATRAELAGLARDLGLVATGSSDYHGTGKVGHDLGICTTEPDAYEALVAAARTMVPAPDETS
jgi:predicted metal-dependent phosphoesterase TrpH